ncbi:MAG: ABC transporter ATP-binding protein [Anaerolineaceae bacterium]|jgi:ABC-2 type transport system ATP-binding protein|nr:ABC transporter ATP-binding protein [Anaerolineaceae bacterium]
MAVDSRSWESKTNWLIETEQLTKKFNGEFGVKEVSIRIPKNAIFGFIGPSGSGKTTTVRLLLGIYPPSSGSALVFGHQPHRFSQTDRSRIGYMPQLFMLQNGLTVWQNLAFVASLYGMLRHRKERIRKRLDLVELTGQEKKRASDLSGGMQRRLSLAAALLHDPDLIFLDEPTAGIDPVLRRKFWDHFQKLKEQGKTLFITTQYVAEAAYCDYVGVMSQGRLLMVETPENLKRIGMGGEIIEIKFTDLLSQAQVAAIRQQADVAAGQIQLLNNEMLQVVVEDASRQIPSLLQWCQENEISVKAAQKIEPSFDDVFVQLINRYRDDS